MSLSRTDPARSHHDNAQNNCSRPKLAAVILTLNEEKHLLRCIESLNGIADEIVVIDCGSTDKTACIAENNNARLLFHPWTNHADQFNWGLTQLGEEIDWVLRIDADEYLTTELASEIFLKLGGVDDSFDGIRFSRRIIFQGRMIRYGGVFPVRVLRLFRRGRGECERRWMDEHIRVKGATQDFSGEIIDENLNSLSWWTDKHNGYASREAIELLNLRYGFMPQDSIAAVRGEGQAGFKRWLKETVYARMPVGFRALVYFFYRYFARLGFLDGRRGTVFHVLQGFWYRYLVDAKVGEVERYKGEKNCGIDEAIQRVLGIDVR
jgi:glycosyltransferase involved in cell wall biosynthesis